MGSVLHKTFMDSLSEDDKEQYREMSINQQKDWYTHWLENRVLTLLSSVKT